MRNPGHSITRNDGARLRRRLNEQNILVGAYYGFIVEKVPGDLHL